MPGNRYDSVARQKESGFSVSHVPANLTGADA